MFTREVTEDDIEQICKLTETREELFYCFPRATFPLTVADVRLSIQTRASATVVEKDGHVVAFANFYRWQEGVCSIGNVIVSSDCRGAGVGRYLISYMTKLAFEKYHAETVTVSCFNRNVAGLLFYPKLGFCPYETESRVDYNGDQVALIHFKVEPDAI
ncbi:MAG TPA: GNAT family N-acetyltransferase [Marinospirillum sp.]|uniref:GNAT family N-acetyltransferase n=1 Tax=Marinospirillum sp. TaxID=2183934 RepID=UPI002B482B04|nr:GNAT family N-acetyltransferase [Marinospirillum sp.]HKM16363.1 GNAT family N-acetyltransferase [Marinospirillum sp.]